MIIAGKNFTKFKIGTVIRQKLIQDSSVRGIIADRMWPLEKLDGSDDGPFLLYELSDYTVNDTKQGPYNESITMWIGCCAADYDATMDLAESVFKCLQGLYDYKDDAKQIIINRITLIDLQQSFFNDKYCSTLKFRIE